MSSACLAPVLYLNMHPSAMMKGRHNMWFHGDCMQSSIFENVIMLEILVSIMKFAGPQPTLGSWLVCETVVLGHSGFAEELGVGVGFLLTFSKGSYERGATGDLAEGSMCHKTWAMGDLVVCWGMQLSAGMAHLYSFRYLG